MELRISKQITFKKNIAIKSLQLTDLLQIDMIHYFLNSQTLQAKLVTDLSKVGLIYFRTLCRKLHQTCNRLD